MNKFVKHWGVSLKVPLRIVGCCQGEMVASATAGKKTREREEFGRRRREDGARRAARRGKRQLLVLMGLPSQLLVLPFPLEIDL